MKMMMGALPIASGFRDRDSHARDEPRPSPSSLEIHALVSAHFASIWRARRAFGVAKDDADDAAQQVFLVASRKLDRVGIGSERAFPLRDGPRHRGQLPKTREPQPRSDRRSARWDQSAKVVVVSRQK